MSLDDLMSAMALSQKLRDDWATLRRLFDPQRTFVLCWKGYTDAGMDEDKAARLCRALHDDYEAKHEAKS